MKPSYKVILTICLLCAFCFTYYAEVSAKSSSRRHRVIKSTPLTNAIIRRAENALGTPYVYGGSKPGGFDCSGLVCWAYKAAGINLPHSAQEQSSIGKAIRSVAQMRAGDIVAFRRTGGYHTGIYLGNGYFIHAPRRHSSVRIESMNTDFFRNNFLGARRVAGGEGEAVSLGDDFEKKIKAYKRGGRYSQQYDHTSDKAVRLRVGKKVRSKERRSLEQKSYRRMRALLERESSKHSKHPKHLQHLKHSKKSKHGRS